MNRAQQFHDKVERIRDEMANSFAYLPDDIKHYLEDGQLAAKGIPLRRSGVITDAEARVLTCEGFKWRYEDRSIDGDDYNYKPLHCYFFVTD